MRHYINIFHTVHLMLFIMYFERSVECFLITPKTVPDDIQLFNSSHDSKDHDLNTVKHKKSWLMYIDANLKKTLSVCFSRMVENTVYSQMWQCTLYFSPSFQILHHKMKKACPVSDKSKTTYTPARITHYIEKLFTNDLADIKPDKFIIGRIIISTAKCPKMLFLKDHFGSLMIVTSYIFQIDTVLRLNVTILHLELLNPEKVEVINGNKCNIHPKWIQISRNCFGVGNFYIFTI